MDSILESVKKIIGLAESYKAFDADLIMHINSAFFTLYQLGVTESPFVIEDDSTTWDEFYPTTDLEAVKTYIALKARTYFDPPTNSSLMSAMNEQLKELEWRINVAVDPKDD